MEEINNETIENENSEIVSEFQNENTSEEVSAIETVTPETINIDYTSLLQQTNYYLNFLIFMFLLFLMLNFVERK